MRICDELEEKIKGCNRCKLCKTRQNIVFGVGNKNAKIMFIGEGPGADEDRLGEPFVGKAGKLMDMAFEAVGIKRQEVYIANIVKCRPPANRNPEDDEAAACMDYLRNQVMIVKPKIIVLLRKCCIKKYTGKGLWNYCIKRKSNRKEANNIYTNMAPSSIT